MSTKRLIVGQRQLSNLSYHLVIRARPASESVRESLSSSNRLSLGPCILVLVTETLFMFESDEDLPRDSGIPDKPIDDEQVSSIRAAFSAAGIHDQERRRQITQSCVVRPLSTLRELTAAEAHRVLKRIKDVAAPKLRPAGGSDWDLREEDTWIDKL